VNFDLSDFLCCSRIIYFVSSSMLKYFASRKFEIVGHSSCFLSSFLLVSGAHSLIFLDNVLETGVINYIQERIVSNLLLFTPFEIDSSIREEI